MTTSSSLELDSSDSLTVSTLEGLMLFGGIAAAAGGTLRIIAAIPFVTRLPEAQALYLTIDCLFLFALLGTYVRHAVEVGRIGLVAFCVGVVSICLIRSQASLGPAAYPVGGLVLTLSMTLLAYRLRARGSFAVAAWLWAATIIVGATGSLRPSLGDLPIMIAGSLFGLGFLSVGMGMPWTRGDRGRLI